MDLRVSRVVGTDYLRPVSDLAQRRRLADPTGGPWEAADLQWWWRVDQHPDDRGHRVWLDRDVPVAAVIFTRWTDDRFGCDAIAAADSAPAWEFAGRRCAELRDVSIEMALADADAAAIAAAERIGFRSSDDTYVACWRDAHEPAVPPLPTGYTLRSRRAAGGEHPMVVRNGAAVETLLRQCPLYDPDLDLAVYTAAGEPAGYALFWADRRTGVGLVEPMRVEPAHQRRGLAAHLRGAGLGGLVARGCSRLNVSYESEVAERLYLGAGFAPTTPARSYVRGPG